MPCNTSVTPCTNFVLIHLGLGLGLGLGLVHGITVVLHGFKYCYTGYYTVPNAVDPL